MNQSFWLNKKVLVTGHTGFKGSWLTMWLHKMGAQITGYALEPDTEPSLFNLCQLDHKINSVIGDIRDYSHLKKTIDEQEPEVIIHMAAQPLVRESYINPMETYSVNVMGTVNLLEAARNSNHIKAIVNVTTDKCYENKEWVWGYRENEPLGGHDPYSSSKACAELVTSAYRNSFFFEDNKQGLAIASARAGNVIGGGDWAKDRLIPDCIRSLLNNETIRIRNPYSIRPWQHVLEPLSGYLLLAEKLYVHGSQYAQAWNFGPSDHDAKPVEWIVKEMCSKWGSNAKFDVDKAQHPHEAQYLKLDCSKANSALGWYPRWDLNTALDKILEWTSVYKADKPVSEICYKQIDEYVNELQLPKQDWR